MIKALGYAANNSFSRLKPMPFEREEPKAGEVRIDILYCGVCHSDIHQAENDWGNTVYPCMPGHEIVGRVVEIGEGVTAHAVGDMVGVGCMIDSCRDCAPCNEGEEQFCEGPNGWLATYNGPMTPAAMSDDGQNMYGRDNTFGGYSNTVTVKEDFVLKIPASIPPQAAAPILCAGVTTFSPMKHWQVGEGDKVGVVGCGGLGHMAVKLALALGAKVVVFTRDKSKVEWIESQGAAAVLENDAQAYKELELSFDLIISTIPEKHKVDPYVGLLKRNATFCAVGALAQMPGYDNQELIMHRRSLAGSLIGSIRETQEVLDFCADRGIAPDVELIDIQDINKAFRRIRDEDVRFRYVIDMASLKREMEEAEA